MRKGFIFSVDSMGAIAIVAVLSIAWVLLLFHETGKSAVQVDKRAKDGAMASLYKARQESDSLDTSKAFASCKKYFRYDDASNSVQEFVHCEEAG